jgi:hypothetical protein
MTAEQIRAEKVNNAREIENSNPSRQEQLHLLIYAAVYEVAAQLAELNHHLQKGNCSVEVFGSLRRVTTAVPR